VDDYNHIITAIGKREQKSDNHVIQASTEHALVLYTMVNANAAKCMHGLLDNVSRLRTIGYLGKNAIIQPIR
jgi:hypothetical protein